MDDFGPDGTQPPPPPRFYPDPLAGLVTGAADQVFPDALAGSVEPAPDLAAASTAAASTAAASTAVPEAQPVRPPVDARRLAARRPARAGPPVHAAPLHGAWSAQRSPYGQLPAQYAQSHPHPASPSPYASPMGHTPSANAPTPFVTPHSPLAQRAAQAAQYTRPPAEMPNKSGAGWVGCLVVLAVLGGLLFPVLRAFVEMLVELFS